MKKFYVVWVGRHPGVYSDWEDALLQIENFPGAKYKGYNSQIEAVEAFRKYADPAEVLLGDLLTRASERREAAAQGERLQQPAYFSYPEVDLDGWAVDASCMGNPGVMEYRGVELKSGRELFRVGPFQDATNNIGEFLAIVHALALMYKNNDWHTVYSDSVSGMAWVRRRQVKTTLKPTENNRRVFELIARGLTWLNTHSYEAKVLKWQTELWGEIPADFGRK